MDGFAHPNAAFDVSSERARVSIDDVANRRRAKSDGRATVRPTRRRYPADE
jgi:hypothetical protein